MLLPLDLLGAGEWGYVAEISGDSAWVNRLAELGIQQGSRLQIIQPGTTCLLSIDGCKLCLRSSDCSQIYVQPLHS